MNILRLRFAKGERDDLVLGAGVHAVGQDEEGRPCLVEDAHDARLQVSVDRRGIWLQLREHAQSMHVNGRPVRRMAMLRPGDTLHMDGVDLVLVGARPGAVPSRHDPDPPKARAVLRALGGTHHGRCFDVDRPCSVGSQADAGVHIAEPGMPAEHSVLEPHADGVSIRTVDPAATIEVNGHRLTEGLLLAGDQVVFNTSHRFVLEAPRVPTGPAQPLPEVLVAPPVAPTPRRSPLVHSLRRIPWLLLAALLMAGALALLLLYGAR
ncbi:FHA domain-containing protein [Lysobacter ciconiae]|uniref:FHA domain-containing protein n=1 Tax=Novilysobacter ciconiae TaxID=2781022 RepID=A0A7S6UEA3_9GAMM|nr:FHA domain-containing protein [Lysobacter ciconiae]QOW18675.1 FHA domain-containing protein [Lysobacter ciconiae]